MRRLVPALLTAVLLTACTQHEAGSPSASQSNPRNVNETISSAPGDAPPIEAPHLDLGKYDGRPCDLLRVTQLRHFAIVEKGGDRESEVGDACAWHAPDTTRGGTVGVTILNELDYGWEGVHDRRDRWQVFEDAGEIDGYPVVHLGDKEDAELGICVTLVGASPDQLFQTNVYMNVPESPEFRDPCAQSDLVAEMVIDTLNGDQ